MEAIHIIHVSQSVAFHLQLDGMLKLPYLFCSCWDYSLSWQSLNFFHELFMISTSKMISGAGNFVFAVLRAQNETFLLSLNKKSSKHRHYLIFKSSQHESHINSWKIKTTFPPCNIFSSVPPAPFACTNYGSEKHSMPEQ